MTVERAAAAIPLQASAAGWRQAVIRTVGRWVKLSSTAWRRSIMLRVVGATLALSVLIVFLLGQLVLGQVRDGLLRAKVKSAVAEASSGFTAANQRLIVAETSSESESTGDLVNDIVQDAANSGGGLYNVVLLSDASPGATTGAALASGGVKLETVTSLPDLVGKVGQSPQPAYAYRYAEILYDSGTAKGLIVGSRIRGYQLYYLFPLDQEQATLNLVRQRLATTGGLLVLLLGLIAYVLTRQVVSPVRMAARISARIAAGQLDERMQVSGEDDLAKLASSFNRMATHLQQQIRQLEDLSRVQRRFVADVSHELRTPLTTVRMAADILHEARDTFHPQVARSAELLQTQLDRFEALLSDLLEISRFDAGAAILEAEPIDLRDIATKVIEAAEPLADRRGAALRLVGAQVPCVAEVDPRRIERVLRNLVVNAIEHCDGRDVVVRVAANDEAVAVAVRDHGVGLKPGEASLVFNRFWRADPARARTTGGTGLGLSIALEDAHLHGGWLQAWGQPGAGSQFRLTVPRAVGQAIDRSPIPLEPVDARRMHSLAELSDLRAGVRGPHAPA
jgi:two-component system, OmpR family, sensor histidine kinase MtrB